MRIVIINPNSDPAQTLQIDKAAKAFAQNRFEVVTLATPGAPQYIDTYLDHAHALPGMLSLVSEWENRADAFIIACHCDPNMNVLREASNHPVLGIGEASMKLASMLGHKFSVVSTGDRGIPNKEANIHAYGLDHSCASLRSPGPECTAQDMAGKLRNAAAHAVAEDKAEVIVLSAAGQSELAAAMSRELGVPVLDGIDCALMLAEGMCRAGFATSKIRRYRREDA